MSTEEKSFGIQVRMPDNDPMSAAHLLGEQWSSTRWYDTEAQRDAAYAEMLDHPRYYRSGDEPSIILEKIDP